MGQFLNYIEYELPLVREEGKGVHFSLGEMNPFLISHEPKG
mgnify:CR=1 FL=1